MIRRLEFYNFVLFRRDARLNLASPFTVSVELEKASRISLGSSLSFVGHDVNGYMLRSFPLQTFEMSCNLECVRCTRNPSFPIWEDFLLNLTTHA